MSETVKLIIEIPKDLYKMCKKYKSCTNDIDIIAIAHGIPLDDVKAEIDKAYEDFDGYDPSDLSEFFKRVYEILDNIGKRDKE